MSILLAYTTLILWHFVSVCYDTMIHCTFLFPNVLQFLHTNKILCCLLLCLHYSIVHSQHKLFVGIVHDNSTLFLWCNSIYQFNTCTNSTQCPAVHLITAFVRCLSPLPAAILCNVYQSIIVLGTLQGGTCYYVNSTWHTSIVPHRLSLCYNAIWLFMSLGAAVAFAAINWYLIPTTACCCQLLVVLTAKVITILEDFINGQALGGIHWAVIFNGWKLCQVLGLCKMQFVTPSIQCIV